MKLNLFERFIALGILPKEGNFVTLKIIQNLKMSLAPSQEEITEFEIKQDGVNTSWNDKGKEDREIEIGEKATDIIIEALKKLDKEKKLTEQHYTIYEKFVKE